MERVAFRVSLALLLSPRIFAAQDTTSLPFTISGYVTTSYTSSARAIGDTIIVGRAYDRRNNTFLINVANLTLERTAPADRVAAGFRAEAWLGPQAALVKSAGLDLGPNADIWQAYVVLNLPMSGKGGDRYLQLKAGKIAALVGLEVGQEPLNPNAAVGYQDLLVEPFTETGVELDARLGPHFDAELRLSNGWDQVVDVNSGKTVTARVGLAPDDKTLLALTASLGPEQVLNNSSSRAGVDVVASRRIASANVVFQLDYGHEDVAGSKATWSAAGTWLTYDLAPNASLALRADYVNDRNGARTAGILGFPANTGMSVRSLTSTLNLKYWAHTLVRPELRFDRATLPVFDGSKAQVSYGVALSYVF
jgi:hypothetical protein